MKTRSLLVISMMGGLLTACDGLGDATGTSDDAVTVHPQGTSTLGSLALELPAGLGPESGRYLALQLEPAAGSTAIESPDTEPLRRGESIRVAPGTYCLTVTSARAYSANTQLTTQDCSIVVRGSQATTYHLARVRVEAAAVAPLFAQQAKTGGISRLTIEGEPYASGWVGAEDAELVATRSVLSTKAFWQGSGTHGSEWPAASTNVPEGGDVTLAVPTGDFMARFAVGQERAGLPDAVSGGGMHWRWADAPSHAYTFRDATDVSAGDDFAFFAGEPGSIVFELGGMERTFSIASAGKTTVYGWRLEVAHVIDTDDQGKTTTLQGLVSVKSSSNGRTLSWRDDRDRSVSSFTTGQSVLVWAGEYDVTVHYTKNGLPKTYSEHVRVP